jgi:hypothetical protein
MNMSSIAWRVGFVAEAVFLLLVVVACAAEPPPVTSIPTPPEAVATTPATEPPGEGGFTAPDSSSLPEAVAPLGLGDVDLPDNADSITALFNRLPPRLMDRERTMQSEAVTPAEISASYGITQPVGCGRVGLQAMDVSTGDFYPPGWTTERVIAVFTTGADWNVEDFGRDRQLFWV